MEWIGALGLSILLGFRHGLDPDHMAAITDMVGTNTKARRSIQLGMMYALGHGLVVLLIGVAAIVLGRSLPQSVLKFTEMLVGVSLLVLGGVIVRSLMVKGSHYEHRSRWEIVVTFWRNLYGRLSGRNLQQRALGTFQVGLLGAMLIGIVHGIGAETPTQLTVIGHSSLLGNTMLSVGILLMFVIGLLMSTSAVSLISAWGFMKARSVRTVNVAMGVLAGGYSLFLGVYIILNA